MQTRSQTRAADAAAAAAALEALEIDDTKQLTNSSGDLLRPGGKKLGYDYSNWPDETIVVPVQILKDVNEFVRLVEFDNIFTTFYQETATHVNMQFHLKLDYGQYYSPMLVQLDKIKLEPPTSFSQESFKDMVLDRYEKELEALLAYYPVTEFNKIIGIQKLSIFQQPYDI
jgi:hypothetical protein